MSEYVDQGIIKEFHADSNTTSYAERVSYGSTDAFTIRAAASISSIGATGISSGSADFVAPPWARGLELYAAVTTVTQGLTTGYLYYAVQPKSPFSADYLSGSSWLGGSVVGTTATFNGTTGDSYLTIYPGVGAVTGGLVPAFSAVLPQTFRVVTTVAGCSADFTFGITGRYVP